MIRAYFSAIIGAGTDPDPYRPAFGETTNAWIGKDWEGEDLRAAEHTPSGHYLVWLDVTDAQHAAIIADVRNTWIPFANGNVALDIRTATVGDMSAARRTEARNLLESHHVPLDDLVTLQTPIRHIVARIIRRKRIRKALCLRYANWRVADSMDLTEGLTTLVSALPAAKRTAFNDRLTALGYDTTVVLSSDTIKQALQKLATQNVQYNRNEWDS